MSLIDDRYQIEDELGRGGMGVVYRARDVNLGRTVALKVIAPELVRDPLIVESFQREAQALAKVKSNHVVQVYAFGPHDSSWFFSMEFVEGVTLASIIDEHVVNGELVPRARALTLLRQLASGLDAVHAMGTVHRDVKPDNVIVEQGSGRPVLIDFGLAVTARSDAASWVAGTPEYVAPEQILGTKELSARTDEYAFATMAFELLSGGHLPFAAESSAEFFKKHAYEEPRKISELRPELTPIDPVFTRALAKDPGERFESCRDFTTAIQRGMDLEDVRWSLPPRTSQPPDELVLNILVVDDDQAFAKFAARAAAITFHGVRARVIVAASGAEALSRAREQPPHLLLLDYDLPGMNGVDALAQLRGLPRGAEMRVVVVSNYAAKERWRFGVLGVEDFIQKPISLPQLLKALEDVVSSSGWQRGLVPRRDSAADLPPRSRPSST